MSDQFVPGLRVQWGARRGSLIWVSDAGTTATFLEAGAEDVGPPMTVRTVDLVVPDIEPLDVACPKCKARPGESDRRVGSTKPVEVEPHPERKKAARDEQARQDRLRKGKKK